MNILNIISFSVQIIGSLALFLFGMKYMSEAIQHMAGSGLRNILATFTANRFKAVLTGAFITSAVQSSSATTVMVVSFVNAGVLSLVNAIGVIMGANIGTTVTAWLITLFGIKYDISTLSIPLIGVGFVCMMLKGKQVRHVGEFLVGFGLLFLGLTSLKESIDNLDLANNSHFISFITGFVSNSGSIGFGSISLFVLIGTLLTVVLQSSSATMALTIILCSQGAIPFEIAVALVLGENIGTTITANLAAAIGNVSAKRSARSHLIFNLLGVIWVLLIFRFFLSGINQLTIFFDGHSPYLTSAAIPIALSLFHTAFNVLNTSMLVWFIPQIEYLTKFMVKTKSTDDDEIFKLEYIDSGFMKVDEIAIESAKKEIQVFAKRIEKMFEFIPVLLDLKEAKEYTALLKRIEHYENVSDRMEIEIANYLTKVSSDRLSAETSCRVQGMLRIVDNLESIADQNYQLAKLIDTKNEQKIWFTPDMRQNINAMFGLVREAIKIMEENLNAHYKTVEIGDALQMENTINRYRDKLRDKHLEDLNKNIYPYQTGIAYSGMYALLEKIGDHIINVSEAIVNAKYTKDDSLTAPVRIEELTDDDQ
ncbi:MAG: Na/Pi cotransporter family protein [Bacteroidales bacterium]|jgi:phosphate:Na+ symporter|nr:Na/Pi cotransporter family protein [Bacteroidales bacterium]